MTRPGDVPIKERDWESLRTAVSGGANLYRPKDTGYKLFYRPQNHVYSYLEPAGIIRILDKTSLNDLLSPEGPVNNAVKTAILWAQEHGIRIATRSGGHSYAGYSATSALLVDFSAQQRFYRPDENNAITFGSGMQGRSLYPNLRYYPNAYIPTGRCPTVAIGGLALGGGIGFLDRKYGLTCDQMLKTTVVTADGEVLVCNAKSEKDLFWAVRGAGHGNFGIHTSFKFQGHPLPGDKVERIGTFFKIEWAIDDAFQLIDLVQKITDEEEPGFGLADKLEVRIGVSTKGSEKDKIKQNLNCNVIGIYHGPMKDFCDLFRPVLDNRIKAKSQILDGPTASLPRTTPSTPSQQSSTPPRVAWLTSVCRSRQ